jgi:predicted nucleotidyltransferase
MYQKIYRKEHRNHKGIKSMATGKDKQLIYQELKQYISLLRDKRIPVLQAYLFGSYATGRADEWSDIDLAIVTDTFVGDSFDFRFMLTKLARTIDPDIEPHPYLLSEFNESNPVAGEILRFGERVD